MRDRFLALFALVALACGGEMPSSDSGMDLPDSAVAEDAGRRPDAGPPPQEDAGMPDEPCESPGAIEDVACGMCGTATRFCTEGRVWEYGPCEGETGECAPGATRDGACGSCGTAQQVCTDTCAWSTIGECTGEGECAPGALIRSGEGCPSGQRDLRCSDACMYEPISECTSDPCTTPGTTENVTCGRCGTRTRFCTAALEWEYGACSDEGECDPGTTRTDACGNCGDQEMRCDSTCAWFPFGECAGQGECAPGSTSVGNQGCASGEQRPLTCSDACAYEPSGACVAPTGQRGDPCTPGSCGAGLVCDGSLDIDICRQTCTAAGQCPDGDWCFTGDMICEDGCTLWTDAGCPSGAYCTAVGVDGSDPLTVCSAIGAGGSGASCTTHADCRRGSVCIIESEGVNRCHALCDSTHACTTGTCMPFDGVGFNTLGYCG